LSKTPPQLADNLCFLINQTAKEQLAWFDREMKALKLDRSQWRLLGYLSFFTDITQSELARLLGIGKAPLGQLIRKLEEAGMIVREPLVTDKRSYNLRVADSHAQLAFMVREMMKLESAQLLQDLPEEEMAQARDVLRHIRNKVQESPESDEIRAIKKDILAEIAKLKKMRSTSAQQ